MRGSADGPKKCFLMAMLTTVGSEKSPLPDGCWCGVRCALCESREAEMISSHCYLLAWVSVHHDTISVVRIHT